MTTAQDQQSRAQSRAEFEAAAKTHRGLSGYDFALMPGHDEYEEWQLQVAFDVWQAARALPAPENVREGEPYDDPAFEDLARTMGVWGTAQSALCAQFFLAGRSAMPAGVEPAGEVVLFGGDPDCKEISWRKGAMPPAGEKLYTAAQVLAMGRVPLEPVEGDILPRMGDKVLIHLARQDAWVEHIVAGYYVWAAHDGDEFQQRVFVRVVGAKGYRNARLLRDVKRLDGSDYLLKRSSRLPAAAPRPPAAQERAYTSPVRTVADLANNLLLMDQALPIFGAQYIEHPPGKRRAIAVSPTVSRERVKDGRWIGDGEELNAAVIWTRAEQPARQERAPLTDERIREIDDETHFHETPGWPVRFARAIEAELRKVPAP